MYLRRVGINGSSYAAAPTRVSTAATPPAPAAKNLGVKKAGVGGGTTAASDKQLESCAAGKMKYAVICIQLQVDPRGDVPSASLYRLP
jgi:hypothetical protein